MTNALLAIDHEANRNHYPTLEETDLNDPIPHCALIDAAPSSARATLAAAEAVAAARPSAPASLPGGLSPTAVRSNGTARATWA